MSDPVLVARGRVAQASRFNNREALDAAKRELEAAKLERYINQALAAAPPLSAAQRERLAMMLLGGGELR